MPRHVSLPQPVARQPVPWWVTAAAIAVPLCVLPSALWRLSLVIDVIRHGQGSCQTVASTGEGIYVASLSIVSIALASLTLGLVRPWGEVFPGWIPFVGGMPVPVRPVTVIATAGATLIALLIAYGTIVSIVAPGWSIKPVPPGCSRPDKDSLVGQYYAPLLAWPPLLYLVTYQYYRRRTSNTAPEEPQDAEIPASGIGYVEGTDDD